MALFFVDYQGLTHKQLEEVRALLKEINSEISIVKNTLMNLALREKKIDAQARLTGAHATLFSYEDPIKTAKALYAFFKKYQLLASPSQGGPKIKFGIFEGKLIDEKTIIELALLPSHEVLLGKLVWVLKSPMSGLVYGLNYNVSKLVVVLKEIEKKKQVS